MTNKEFKKMFKEEYNKESSCKITLEDVLPAKQQDNSIIYANYVKQKKLTKFFAFNSLVTVALLIVAIVFMSIQYKDYQTTINSNPLELPKEAEEFILSHCEREKKYELIGYEKIINNIYISIYSINKIDLNGEKKSQYFYYINYKYEDLSLKFNGENVQIDEKQYGKLGTMDSIEFGVEIEIIYRSSTKKIIFTKK